MKPYPTKKYYICEESDNAKSYHHLQCSKDFYDFEQIKISLINSLSDNVSKNLTKTKEPLSKEDEKALNTFLINHPNIGKCHFLSIWDVCCLSAEQSLSSILYSQFLIYVENNDKKNIKKILKEVSYKPFQNYILEFVKNNITINFEMFSYILKYSKIDTKELTEYAIKVKKDIDKDSNSGVFYSQQENAIKNCKYLINFIKIKKLNV